MKLNEIKNVEAIFCDIDGTLIDSKNNLSKEVIDQIKKLKIPFFFVSGRNYSQMERYAKELNLKTPRLTINGNLIIQDNNILYRGPYITKDELKDLILPYLLKYKDEISIQLYNEKDWICNTKNNKHVQYEMSVLQKDPDIIFSSIDEVYNLKIAKVLFVADIPICDLMMNEIHEKFPKLSVIRNHPTYVEVYKSNSNKGIGALEACKLFSLNPKNCIAIGDSAVDIPLLDSVYYSCCVKNADIEVKKHAKIILPSNDDNGVFFLLKNIEGII